MKLDVLDTPSADRASPEPWYADGLKFTCTQCGNCCTGGPGFVWISPEEVARLAEFLHLPVKEVVERYCRSIGRRLSLKENLSKRGEYDCVFLKEEKGRRTCTIYPVRPLQCRTWPFWEGNLTSLETWNKSARRCPGMNGGKAYTRQQVEALRDAKEWPEKAPTSD